MSLVNISKASLMVGKSRKTLYRKMKDGELSYKKTSDNKREIDTSELIRVFGDISQETVKGNKTSKHDENYQLDMALKEIEQLKTLIDEKNKRIQEKENYIDNLQLLLEHQKPKESGIDRLFGALADRIKIT